MLENPWFKQTNSFAAPKNGHPSVYGNFETGCSYLYWFNDHPPNFEDPELRGCSKRCMGTGPHRTVTSGDHVTGSLVKTKGEENIHR